MIVGRTLDCIVSKDNPEWKLIPSLLDPESLSFTYTWLNSSNLNLPFKNTQLIPVFTLHRNHSKFSTWAHKFKWLLCTNLIGSKNSAHVPHELIPLTTYLLSF